MRDRLVACSCCKWWARWGAAGQRPLGQSPSGTDCIRRPGWRWSCLRRGAGRSSRWSWGTWIRHELSSWMGCYNANKFKSSDTLMQRKTCATNEKLTFLTRLLRFARKANILFKKSWIIRNCERANLLRNAIFFANSANLGQKWSLSADCNAMSAIWLWI